MSESSNACLHNPASLYDTVGPEPMGVSNEVLKRGSHNVFRGTDAS